METAKKRKSPPLTMVLSLLGAVAIPMGTSSVSADAGYAVYKMTDSDAAGTIVGGAAGGAVAYYDGETGAKIGGMAGGIAGAAIGGALGAA
jgi:hypothetical protein